MFRGLLRSQENFIKHSLKKVCGSIIEFGQNQPRGHWDKSEDEKESYRRANAVVKMDRKGCEMLLKGRCYFRCEVRLCPLFQFALGSFISHLKLTMNGFVFTTRLCCVETFGNEFHGSSVK